MDEEVYRKEEGEERELEVFYKPGSGMCRESTKQHQDIVSLQSPRRNIFHLLTGMLTSYSSEGVSCVNSFNFLARTKIGFVWNVIGCL